MDWIDATKSVPPDNKHPVGYLTILQTLAKAQHCKRWAGMGCPEITYYHQGWPSGWNARGSLSVAYWMPLPKFNGTWEPGIQGEEGRWILQPPAAVRRYMNEANTANEGA